MKIHLTFVCVFSDKRENPTHLRTQNRESHLYGQTSSNIRCAIFNCQELNPASIAQRCALYLCANLHLPSYQITEHQLQCITLHSHFFIYSYAACGCLAASFSGGVAVPLMQYPVTSTLELISLTLEGWHAESTHLMLIRVRHRA